MFRLRSAVIASLLAFAPPLLLAACNLEDGPLMSPGADCMQCHVRGGGAPTWTVAGTIFSKAVDTVNDGVDGVQVVITDANNKTITLTTNAAGNFYTRESVTFPISAALHRGSAFAAMKQQVSTGACSSCHNDPPNSGAPGRNFIAAP